MNSTHFRSIRRILVTIATLFCGFFVAANALAAVVTCPTGYVATSGVCIFKATGASAVSADFNLATGTGTYLNLLGPIIAETTPGQIGSSGIPGSLVLIAPSGFQFKNDSQNDPVTALVTELDSNNNTAHNINGLASGSTIPALVSTTSAGLSAVTISLTSTTTAGNYNSLTWQGIEIVPSSGVPAVGQTLLPSGNILKAGGSVGVLGVSGSAIQPPGTPTSLGSVGEVQGAMTQATISATKTQISPFSTTTLTVTNIKDQFGNAIPDGTSLGLETSLGTLSTSGCGTITGGQVTCTLSSTATGTVTLSIPGVTALGGTTSITVVPGPTTQLAISASSKTLTFDKTSTITVSGKDFYNNPTTSDSSTSVVLSVDNGGTLDNNVLTFSNGSATATLSDSTAGTVSVVASSGSFVPVSVKVTFLQVDTQAPFVASVIPDGTSSVDPTDATYAITFSKPLDTNTVSSANIQLVNASDDSVVPAIVSPAEGDTEVLIQPTTPLDYSTTYYFAVSSAVTDQAAPVENALLPTLVSPTAADTTNDPTSQVSYSFTTEDDPTVLGITGVTLTKSSATADDEFDDGWQWVMDVTVPTDESQVSINFDNWTNTDLTDTIPVLGDVAGDTNDPNVEFWSPQSTDAPDEADATLVSSSLETLQASQSQQLSNNNSKFGGGTIQQLPSDSIDVSGDMDPKTPGNQIQLYIDVKIPTDAVPGSYFTQYDLSSN